MSCKFCEKVWSSAEAFKKSALCLTECSIIMRNRKHWLYNALIFGDQIWWDDYMLQIDYCPCCGRKLTEENK